MAVDIKTLNMVKGILIGKQAERKKELMKFRREENYTKCCFLQTEIDLIKEIHEEINASVCREEIRDRTLYYKNGKQYRKLERDEIIKKGAMQSWCLGELQPITNADGKTVGSTPSIFSNERAFYNPVEEIDWVKKHTR